LKITPIDIFVCSDVNVLQRNVIGWGLVENLRCLLKGREGSFEGCVE